MEKLTYRPPPLEKKFQHILYYLHWNGRGTVRRLIEKALASFLINELDVTTHEQYNNNDFDVKEAELLTLWLKKKEDELYRDEKT